MKKNIPKLKTKGARVFALKLFSFLFIVCPLLVISVVSCDDDKSDLRGEYIFVTKTLNGDLYEKHLVAELDGDEADIYIHSNVDYDVTFQTNDKSDREWLDVANLEATSDPSVKKLHIKAKPRGAEDWKERIGSVGITSKDNSLARFLEIRQGYPHHIDEEFTWLIYGGTDPLDEASEKSMDRWSDQETERGWSSTAPTTTFGKNGFIKLGDGVSKGDISTPFVNAINRDSILIVSFDGLAYTSKNGTKDANKLTVRITGGGVFSADKDASDEAELVTEKVIELKHYNPAYASLGTTMWDVPNNRYSLRIESSEKSKLSSATRIQFIGGEGDIANRVFLDNVQLFIVNDMHLYMLNAEHIIK